MCDRSSDPTEHDAARERPSALDVAVVESVLYASEEEGLDTYTTAKLVVARLAEPDAEEGPVGPVRIRSANCRAGDHGDCLGMVEQDVPGLGITDCLCDCHPMPAPTPDTTEATLRAPLSAEEEAALRAGAEFWPVDTVRRLLATLDAARERPSALDVEALALALSEWEDGDARRPSQRLMQRLMVGASDLAAIYARLTEPDVGEGTEQPAVQPEHEHYWTDAPDDEEAWHCSICGLTEYPASPPYGSDSAAVQPEGGPE